MRRAVLLSFVLVALGLMPEPASAALTTVDIVEVRGPLDRPLVAYLEERIDEAERGMHVLVLQLDTPGTLDQDAVGLAQRIFDARVPVIVWVGPPPARASGAGLLFMYASSLAAVSPGSQTGPLLPLDLADGSVDLLDLRATIDGWVAARGKETVTDWNDRPLTASEARHRDIAQAAAISVPDLLGKIDGRTVKTPAGPVTLQTNVATKETEVGEVTLRFHDLGPIRAVLHAISNPSSLYLLLVLALAALAFELTQPGFGFAGFSGVFLLGLAVYSLTVVPVSVPGLVLLVGGVGLMVLDVRLRRLGFATGTGLLSFFGGSILAFWDAADPIRVSTWAIGLAVVASLLYYGFGLTVALQARDRITSTQVGLVGLLGETRGELSPEGPVYVKGALWRGRSGDGPIPPGTRVRVRGVDGLILRVEPEPGDED
ncbi:MAG TPA: NfeD family protein [Actinomycetota bacterium]|nr:NfeD family protein [Actinomycetota bacterium]